MKISQREARRNKKRMIELQDLLDSQLRVWTSDYPGGCLLATEQFEPTNYAVIAAARKLGHPVVCVPGGKDTYVYLYGVRKS